MSKEKILNEDWEDYDNLKKKKGDSHFFSCDEEWEIDYLLNKILKHFPNFTTDQIKEAISQCCKTVQGNKPREKFVDCVMNRLGLGNNPPDNPNQGPKNPPIPPANRNVG